MPLFLLFLRITKYPKGILCSLSSATLPQKEDARWHPAAVGRVLFSNAPAGADNRIAPGNNTVPFPEISAPLIFVGAVTCCDASYLAAHCRISHRKRRSPPQARPPPPPPPPPKKKRQSRSHPRKPRSRSSKSGCPLSCWACGHCGMDSRPCRFSPPGFHRMKQPAGW